MNYFGMFSKAGDAAVKHIVDCNIENGSAWLEVYQQLHNLSQVNVFAEATDTAVREYVWSYYHENEKV
jgi:hypothetical protein